MCKSKIPKSQLEALCDPVSPVTGGLHVRHLGGEQAIFLGDFQVSVSRDLFSEIVGLFFETVHSREQSSNVYTSWHSESKVYTMIYPGGILPAVN